MKWSEQANTAMRAARTALGTTDAQMPQLRLGSGPNVSERRAFFSLRKETLSMSSLFWLSEAQMEPLKPFCPKSHGEPRVDVHGWTAEMSGP